VVKPNERVVKCIWVKFNWEESSVKCSEVEGSVGKCSEVE
jgi:hypothetical protein